MSVPPAIEIEALLSEDRWMRRLARRLVVDRDTAEDLAQDAWVAALATRGAARGPRSLRPWLRGVLRHLGLDRRAAETARQQRERRGARHEALASADELVSQLELRQRVATALLELGEPERRTLTLRFFRDLTLKEIAEAEGVSVTAIHERVQRGLARLRSRLDREHGGRRAGWIPGLLALTGEHGGWTWMAEAMAMGTGLKVAATTLLVGGGFLVAWMAHEEREAPVMGAVPNGPAAHGSPAPGPALEPPAPALARENARSAVPAPRAVPAEPAAPAATVEGRVVAPDGTGMRALEVGWSPRREALEPVARSDDSGTFELARRPEAADEDRIVCHSPGYATLIPGREGLDEPLVVVAPRASFAGFVLDPTGAPVPQASARLRLRDVLLRRLGLAWSAPGPLEHAVRCDDQGRFALAAVGGDSVYLSVEADGFWPEEVALPVAGDERLVVTLRPLSSDIVLRGLVIDTLGQPVSQARVSAGTNIVGTDDEGRFELRVAERRPTSVPLGDERWLVAVKAGRAPARERLAELDTSVPVVLRLGPEPAAIAGRVVDGTGMPRPGAVVWVLDPTPFGQVETSVAEGATVAWNTTVEELLTGTSGTTGVRADAQGAFRLGGLLPRDYRLMATDPASLQRAGPWTVQGGRRNLELVLPRGAPVRVAGRVVSLAGEPIAGITLFAQRAADGDGSPYSEPPQRLASSLETDAEGRFAFEGLRVEGTRLVLHHPRLFLREVSLEGRHDLEHLEIVEPLQCELQVDLTADPGLADTVEVLDEYGEKLETIESFGNGWSMGTQASFRDGLTGVLSVREDARTLVLSRAGQEVLRRPLTLDPGQRTTVRP